MSFITCESRSWTARGQGTLLSSFSNQGTLIIDRTGAYSLRRQVNDEDEICYQQ